MQEKIVLLETAKLAKEKGFNWSVINYYTKPNKHNKKSYLTESEGYMTERLESSDWNNGQGSYPTMPERVECSAPTQALLQKWLREVHDIEVYVRSTRDFKGKKHYIAFIAERNGCLETYHETYESALEHGLQEALKLIPDEKHSK